MDGAEGEPIKMGRLGEFFGVISEKFGKLTASYRCGAVAQLGERRVRNAEARGSIPLCSTKIQKSPVRGVLHFGRVKKGIESEQPYATG